MTIGKRSIQAVVLAAGALLLAGCYTVVDGRHHHRPGPSFQHRHYDYRPHDSHRNHHYWHEDRRDRRGGDRRRRG